MVDDNFRTRKSERDFSSPFRTARQPHPPDFVFLSPSLISLLSIAARIVL
jgi:hypothetical protein